MLQMRSKTIVLVGVTVALLGAVLVFVYARGVTARAGGENAVDAFVASKDIPAGTAWASAAPSVKRHSVPVSLRPANAVTTPQRQLAGRTSVRKITKGEVITAAQFGQTEAAPGAGLEIPPKHNAVTMNLASPQGVAHYAQAGDLVNIFVTTKNAEGNGSITKLLQSNVQVLANRSAVAEQREGVAGGGEVLLTLALTPGQAEKVIFAKENGSLWFGLVHPGDGPASTGAGRTAQSLFN
jgi:pilus assembly protein CpaB